MIGDVAGSIIVSGLGAVMTVLLARAWAVYRAVRLKRLCSIEGTFISELDRGVGLPQMREALTQISQQGTRVRGITTCLRTQRWWQLEGEIDESGFLRGVYTDGRTSARVGSFLLAIEEGGDALTGLWTLCDSAHRQVEAARYALRRCRNEQRKPPWTDGAATPRPAGRRRPTRVGC